MTRALLEEFLLVSEVASGKPLADPVFQCKYGAPAPAYGHHVLTLCRDGRGGWQAAAYVNYLPHQGAMLIGGACTDGQILRTLPKPERAAIAEAGGLMRLMVEYAEARFAARSLGTFGHCGDARSWQVLQQCGYVQLDHPHLVVRWNREPPAPQRAALIASVDALGPF